MIQAVIFDMDGLLIDSEPLWRMAEKKVFATVDIHLEDADFEQFMGFKINEVVEHWMIKKPWKNKTSKEVENGILDELDLLIKEKGKPMRGVYGSLNFFAKKNVPLAIASSSPQRIIQVVIKKLNLQPFFKIIHSAETELHGKPHPAVYINTAKQLSVSEKNCLVLEDSFNGLISAKAARMKTICIPDEKHFTQTRFDIADVKLNSLAEISEDLWINLNKN